MRRPSHRTWAGAAALAVLPLLAGGCSLCRRDDGLSPAAWEARERATALRKLPAVLEAFEARGARVVAEAAPRGALLTLIGHPRDTTFDLGGAHDMNGPLYARACVRMFELASSYSLRQDAAWVTSDSLVILHLNATTATPDEEADEIMRRPAKRYYDPLVAYRTAMPLEDVGAVEYHSLPDGGFVDVVQVSKNIRYMVRPGFTASGHASTFAARAQELAAARASQGRGASPD